MINHIETLLLNETQSFLRESGFGYGEPWLIDPKFTKVVIPRNLVSVEKSLFYGVSSIEDRKNRVISLMPYVNCPDLSKYRSIFDKRSTSTAGYTDSIYGFFNSYKLVSGEFDSKFPGIAISSGVFSSTGFNDFDSALHSLSSMATSSFERPIVIGSCLLAYCLQLEAIRRRS